MPPATSNFATLKTSLPHVHELGRLAEQAFQRDPRATMAHLRVFGERLALELLRAHRLASYKESQMERLRRLKYETSIEGTPFDHLHTLRREGNKAVHGYDVVGHGEAMKMLMAAHRLASWYWRHYTQKVPPKPGKFIKPRSGHVRSVVDVEPQETSGTSEDPGRILEMPEVATHSEVGPAFESLSESTQAAAAKLLKAFRAKPLSDAWPLIRPEEDVSDDKVRLVEHDGVVLVVVEVPNGDILIIATVSGDRKQALTWAKSKRFEVHPMLGILQVFDVQGANAVSESFLGGLFDKHDDETLRSVGVPDDLLESVRNVATESDLDELSPHVPPNVSDALFLLAAGESVPELKRQLDIERVPDIDPTDFAVAVHHPESRRTFALLENNDDLEAVLAGSLAAWRVYLHPDQRRLVTMKANGPIRVLGGAGTGKTVALLHRARHLALRVFGEPSERLLITSFTKNLPQDLRAQMSQLVDRDNLRRMDFVHLHGYAGELWKTHGDGRRVVYDVDSAWDKAMELDTLQLGRSFYEAEWERVVQDQGITDQTAYLRCRRPGRGSPLARSKRRVVWTVFNAFRATLDDERAIESADMFRILADKIRSGDIPREYISVLCDEVQDFGSPELRFMRALVEPSPNDLFFVGDTHQRIYGHEVAMGRCGIAIQGRARRLRVNYRTTARVRQFAVGALTGLRFDDMDGGEQDLKGYRSIRVGRPPTLTLAKSKTTEHKAVVAQVERWCTDVLPETVCVAAPTKSVLKGLSRALQNAGIDTYEIQADVSDTGSGVRLATFARMKGLEFQRVLLAGVNEGLVPLRPSSFYTMDDEGKSLFDRQQRCLLYVAATRARDELAVTGHGRPSPFLLETPTPEAAPPTEGTKRCPRCGAEGEIGSLFGFRRCRRTKSDGTEVVVKTAQSYCRDCR